MEQAVHGQKGELGLLLLPEPRRLANRGRPRNRDVSKMLALAGEREHVGGTVFPRERKVEMAQLLIAGQPDRHGRMPFRQARRDLRQFCRAGKHAADERRGHVGRHHLHDFRFDYSHGR